MQTLSPMHPQESQAILEGQQPASAGGFSDGSDKLEPPAPATRMGKQLAKTRFCNHHFRGSCRYQEQCAYAHSMKELQPRPNLTKTKLCVMFRSGNCNNRNCSHAHGQAELRQNAENCEQMMGLVLPDDGWIPEGLKAHFSQSVPGCGGQQQQQNMQQQQNIQQQQQQQQHMQQQHMPQQHMQQQHMQQQHMQQHNMQQNNQWGGASEQAWHSAAPVQRLEDERLVGRIKRYTDAPGGGGGYGFIDCEDTKLRFTRDVYIHRNQMVGMNVGDEVVFSIVRNSKGEPQARNVVRKEDELLLRTGVAAPHMSMAGAHPALAQNPNLMTEEQARQFQASLRGMGN